MSWHEQRVPYSYTKASAFYSVSDWQQEISWWIICYKMQILSFCGWSSVKAGKIGLGGYSVTWAEGCQASRCLEVSNTQPSITACKYVDSHVCIDQSTKENGFEFNKITRPLSDTT